MPLCKKCGKKIEKPYRYCDACNDEIARSGTLPSFSHKKYSNVKNWEVSHEGRVIERRLKAEADESGNPKTWRAGEYTQDELRRLIPNK